MTDVHREKKSKRLFLKTMAVSTIILIIALGLLGYLSLYSKRMLALESAEYMGNKKLKGDMLSFEYKVAKEYGKLILKDNDLVDINGNSLKHNYAVVDGISRDLDIVATIFIRENNDFRRLATSITKADGSRAVDTFLGYASPAYNPIMSGNPYSGQATILGKDYIVEYKPIFDGNTKNVIGVLFIGLEISTLEHHVEEASGSQTMISIVIGVFLLLMVVVANAVGIAFIILRPISKVTLILRDISEGEGDLTQSIPITSKDEVGLLSYYFNKLINTMRGPIGDTKATIDNLAAASEELSVISRQLYSVSEKTLNQTTAVSDKVGKMSVNINAMATGAEQAGVNANEVAGVAEQMSTNMNTISAAIEER